MIELKDTTPLMTSEDYKERFMAEYLQLKIRHDKLRAFCNKIKANNLTGKEETKHDCPLKLLETQLKAMDNYMRILELRAEIEGIDLDNFAL